MEIVLFLIFCGIAGGGMLSRYNKAGTGCLLGVFLGPIGLLIAWTMRDDRKQIENQSMMKSMQQRSMAAHPTRYERKCPFCAEMILVEAKVCKHCGRDIVKKPDFEFDIADEIGPPDPPKQDKPKQDQKKQKVHCKCGANLLAKPSLSGKTVRCPKCQQPLRIP